ncbi:MAG: lysophospholipase [Treponema sp.]|nr:lysophospholipase [Treponema sp.]
MRKSEQWIASDNNADLFVRRWSPPDENARAVVNIVHGMAEHGERYNRLAERLTAEGIVVWAADMRGHGKTADSSINDPGHGGLLGHCADENAIDVLTSDINVVNNAIMREYPGTPVFLFGHSWGSFLTQNYIETYGTIPLAGCILSGTRGPDGLLIAASKPVMSFLAALRGCRNPSKLAYALAIGPYNRPFKPNRTAVDWLSRDDEEVNAYVADKLCGNMSSVGFFKDLSILLNKIHKKESLSNIRQNLPIYIVGGSADPVGDMGKSPTALVDAYRSLGIQDLEFALYPDARHEMLNETNREEVINNLITWLMRHIA